MYVACTGERERHDKRRVSGRYGGWTENEVR